MHEQIKLPNYFSEKLNQDPVLKGQLLVTLSNFEPWLAQSGMPFFPGFTDHSPRHINEVLETASSLITDAARDLLSARDIAVLALAILLHDCGMHLTVDGFDALVQDDTVPPCASLGDRPWRTLWTDFLSEASRFDDSKLLAIFGDTKPISVTRIATDNLNEREKLLAGEFVRRHHARLAHEIAIRGVPIENTANGRLTLTDFEEDVKDIAGLIARSHGLSIRQPFNYIKERYDLREYRKTHIVFLMGVLRIADYMQVQSERAIQALLKVKELRSPISRQEWKAHFAVRDVTTSHEDPEALFVRVAPPEVKTFLKLKRLFKDIQRELDETWAALGETYGRFPPSDKLGLTIRRIRSNIDDEDKFARTVDYIPVDARFDASGAELLKLLVGPLYSYDAKIGVRELIQNAVDACRERHNLALTWRSEDEKTQKQDVVVRLVASNAGSTRFIEISDKGVGMALSTVTNFFLKAGASFRSSDIWKQAHLDAKGNSTVARGGRFGVGALAAFLLGDQIEVWTRHYSEPAFGGLHFRAKLSDTEIELRRATLPIGTRLRIPITDDDLWSELLPPSYGVKRSSDGALTIDSWPEFEWYYLEKPELLIEYDGPLEDFTGNDTEHGKVTLCSPSHYVPEIVCPPLWNKLSTTTVDAAYWTYASEKMEENGRAFHRDLGPGLTVNGILIPDNERFSNLRILSGRRESETPIFIKRPTLALTDRNGTLPINLQRDELAFDKFDLDGDLFIDIWHSYIAFLLRYAPTNTEMNDSFRDAYLKVCSYPALQFIYGREEFPLLVTNKGVLLLSPSILAELPIRRILVTEIADMREEFDASILADDEALLLTRYGRGKAGVLAWFRSAISTSYEAEGFAGNYRPALTNMLPVIGTLTSVGKELFTHATRQGNIRRGLIESLRNLGQANGATILATGESVVDELQKRFFKLTSELGDAGAQKSSYWLLGERRPDFEQSVQAREWLTVLSRSIVPFSAQVRQAECAAAFTSLRRFLDQYEYLDANRDKYKL